MFKPEDITHNIMFMLKKLFITILIASALSACGGGGGGGGGGTDDADDEQEITGITVEGSMLRMEVENTYSGDGFADVQKRLNAISDDTIYSISADVLVDPSTMVTENAIIETELRMNYLASSPSTLNGDEGFYGFFMRMRDVGNGDGPRVYAYAYICTDENCTTSLEESIPIVVASFNYSTVNWLLSNTLSVAYNDGTDGFGQRFIFSFNSESLELSVTDINNSTFFQDNGIIFNPEDLFWAQIRSRVKRIDNPGESGLIVAYFDNVMINGELFDDFSTGLDELKWELGQVNKN